MKLPPIWAEFPPFANPDITKKNPPTAADTTLKKPKAEVIRTARDFDQRKERPRTIPERITRIIPMTVCDTREYPTLWTSPKNPAIV
jgi:hypothetical protein